MKRSTDLLDKRREFVMTYIKNNSHKQMKVITFELSEMLFLTERTIYTIINEGIGRKRNNKRTN